MKGKKCRLCPRVGTHALGLCNTCYRRESRERKKQIAEIEELERDNARTEAELDQQIKRAGEGEMYILEIRRGWMTERLLVPEEALYAPIVDTKMQEA